MPPLNPPIPPPPQPCSPRLPLPLPTVQTATAGSVSHWTYVQFTPSVPPFSHWSETLRATRGDPPRPPHCPLPTTSSVINPPTERLGLTPSAAHICGTKIDLIRHDRCRCENHPDPTRTFSFANEAAARAGTSRRPGDARRRMRGGGAPQPRRLPSLRSHVAISLQSAAASCAHGSASIRCVSAAQRGSLIQTSGIPPPRRRFARLSAAHHITSHQAFIISSAPTPAPRSYRLLTTGPVSEVSPVSERVRKKKKRGEKTPTQGHLRWIHPPPLEPVTEAPPLPSPILLR